MEFIGPKYTEDNIIIYEDTIMSIALFIIAKSYYYLKETGYYRSNFECLKSKSNNTKKKVYRKEFSLVIRKSSIFL